jgi:hypothetical protein
LLNIPQRSPLEVPYHAEINAIIQATAQANGLGSAEEVRRIVDAYFDGPHKRISILARGEFRTELVHVMLLILQRPNDEASNLCSLLYLRVKSLICLLEANMPDDLQVMQARILVAYYELAHGMLEAASRSIGACAKAARSKDFRVFGDDNDNPVFIQQRRRAWWALYNLDR